MSRMLPKDHLLAGCMIRSNGVGVESEAKTARVLGPNLGKRVKAGGDSHGNVSRANGLFIFAGPGTGAAAGRRVTLKRLRYVRLAV